MHSVCYFVKMDVRVVLSLHLRYKIFRFYIVGSFLLFFSEYNTFSIVICMRVVEMDEKALYASNARFWGWFWTILTKYEYKDSKIVVRRVVPKFSYSCQSWAVFFLFIFKLYYTSPSEDSGILLSRIYYIFV